MAFGPCSCDEALEDGPSLHEVPHVEELLAVVEGGAVHSPAAVPAASSKAIARSNRATSISPVTSLLKKATPPTVSASSDSVTDPCGHSLGPLGETQRLDRAAQLVLGGGELNEQLHRQRDVVGDEIERAEQCVAGRSGVTLVLDPTEREQQLGPLARRRIGRQRGTHEPCRTVGVTRRIGQIDRRQDPPMPLRGAR